MEPHEVYWEYINVVHQRPLTPLLANYSAMVGIAGAIFLFWGWARLRPVESDGAERRFALPVAVALMIAGLTNPILEVLQPGRVMNMYLFGWDVAGSAIIKFGVTLLPLFALLCWWLGAAALRPEIEAALHGRPAAVSAAGDLLTLWVRHFDPLAASCCRKAIISLGLLLAVFAILYSGVFLMTEHGIVFWDSAFLPVVFFASAVAGGAGMLGLIVPLGRHLTGNAGEETASGPYAGLLAASVAGGALWLLWLQFTGHFGSVEVRRALDLVNGSRRGLAWGWWFGLGAVLPTLLLAVSPLRRIALFRYIASAGAVIGAFALRFAVLEIGQAVPKSGAGQYLYAPPAGMLSDLVLNWVYFVGWIALFWLLLPYRVRARGAATTIA